MAKQVPCTVCGTLLTKADLQAGKAVVVNKVVFCAEHDPRRQKQTSRASRRAAAAGSARTSAQSAARSSRRGAAAKSPSRRVRAAEAAPAEPDIEIVADEEFRPQGSKKGLFIGLGAVIIILLIAVIAILAGGGDDSRQPAEEPADTVPDYSVQFDPDKEPAAGSAVPDAETDDEQADEPDADEPEPVAVEPADDNADPAADEPEPELDNEIMSEALAGELAAVNDMIDSGKTADALIYLRDLRGRFTGSADRKALQEAEGRLRIVADDKFNSNLAVADQYMAEGNVEVALELLRSITEMAVFPDQKTRLQQKISGITAFGDDERTLDALALYYRADAAMKNEKTSEAYDLYKELTAEYMDTAFYEQKKADIGSQMTELKKAQLESGSSTLVYFNDFDGGVGDWSGSPAENSELLESGAMKLAYQPANKWHSQHARVNYQFECPSSNGYVIMRYYTDTPVAINFRIKNQTQRDNFDFRIKAPIPERWNWVVCPLQSFEDAAHKSKKFAKGDIVTSLAVSSGPPGMEVTVLIDEIAVVFGGIPEVYKKALEADKKATENLVTDKETDFFTFDASVLKTVMELNRDNVKQKSILIFGDRTARALRFKKEGRLIESGQLGRSDTYEQLLDELKAEIADLEYTPEVTVVLAGFDELSALRRPLLEVRKALDNARDWGLEPQHGDGPGGWWIWPNSKIKYSDAGDQKSYVETDKKGPHGKPVSCTCDLYKSKGTCDHFEFLMNRYKQKEGRLDYAKKVQAEYEKAAFWLKSQGSLPILISPPYVKDPYRLVDAWNLDYKNAVYKAAEKEQVPFIGLYALVTDPENGRRLRGGSTGVTSRGYKALIEKLGELYERIEKYGFRRE